MLARVSVAALLVALVACGSSSSTPPPDAGGGDTSAADATAPVDAARPDSAPADASQADAARPDAGDPSGGCAAAGGVCGCAGGCGPGYHPAPGALLDMCPQPCDTCGACSQQCCLPDDAPDAGGPGGCGGMTCAGGQRCIRPCCGGAEPPCLPSPDGGPCPDGSATCSLEGGGEGCVTSCTPPPPYCSDTVPVGCMLDASGEVLCLCA